jgi:hypothetical protein
LRQKEVEEEIRWNDITQGRHKNLGNKQVLFTEELECQFCNKPCCFVLEGWNGNATMMHFGDRTIAYDPTFTDENLNHSRKHVCSNEDPAEMFRILDRKIDSLNKKIDDQAEYNKRFYQNRPFL